MAVIADEIKMYFAKIIEAQTGIVYGTGNLHQLDTRLAELAKLCGHASVDALWSAVKLRGLTVHEREIILDLATNNETSFFRDPEIFEFFRQQFVPHFGTAGTPLRIWCAATSTGQEPYSLAMIMAELALVKAARPYEILATDISERVLKQASEGIYSQLEIQRGLPAMLMVRYFDQIQSQGSTLPKFRVKAELARSISFRRLNLLEPWPPMRPFDIIFCRNVLIYQGVENKKIVINRMANLLSNDGYLVLGGAESLLGLSEAFDLERFGRACVYRRKKSVRATG